jgi:hypothetical protein
VVASGGITSYRVAPYNSAASNHLLLVESLVKSGFGQLGLKLPITPVVSMGRRNTGLQFTRRRLKAQGLSRTLIETQRDLVEMDLRVDG